MERQGRLTDKQRAWVDYYKQGHTLADAARLAGYRAGSERALQSIGSRNLQRLGGYIRERDKLLEGDRVADMREINAFWTEIVRDREEKTSDRLKASELRAKAAGAFIGKVEHSGETGLRIELGAAEELAE